MLVVHGLWVYGASYLWAEESALPAAAPARPGRLSRAPRPHPFALQASGLARAFARLPEPAAGLAGQAVDDELTLRLPSGTDGPLASPELIRPPGQDGAGASRPGGRRVSLAPWRVPALAFEPAPAVDLLTVLGEPGALSGEVIGGSVLTRGDVMVRLILLVFALVCFALALLAMMVAIPWPGLTHGRPLLRVWPSAGP